MKVLGVIIAAVILIGLLLALAAVPTMLVLGYLHNSGMDYVPALGFWQTLGSMYIISVVGGCFRAGQVRSETK